MNAEILTSLTAAKGVPFDGKGATPQELAEQSAWFIPGNGARNGKVRWNLPRGDRSVKTAEWTLAEAAMACKGLDDKYFYAIRYQFALDDSVYHDLNRTLLRFARHQHRRQRWPRSVMTLPITTKTVDGAGVEKISIIPARERPYLATLVEMQLVEVRQPWRFVREDSKAPGMWRIVMNVNKDCWSRKLQPIYETIGDEYRRWIGIGVRHMRRWIAETGT